MTNSNQQGKEDKFRDTGQNDRDRRSSGEGDDRNRESRRGDNAREEQQQRSGGQRMPDRDRGGLPGEPGFDGDESEMEIDRERRQAGAGQRR
jgi:hypothetical protein